MLSGRTRAATRRGFSRYGLALSVGGVSLFFLVALAVPAFGAVSGSLLGDLGGSFSLTRVNYRAVFRSVDLLGPLERSLAYGAITATITVVGGFVAARLLSRDEFGLYALVISSLAAALIGRLQSLWATLFGGLAVGARGLALLARGLTGAAGPLAGAPLAGPTARAGGRAGRPDRARPPRRRARTTRARRRARSARRSPRSSRRRASGSPGRTPAARPAGGPFPPARCFRIQPRRARGSRPARARG